MDLHILLNNESEQNSNNIISTLPPTLSLKN